MKDFTAVKISPKVTCGVLLLPVDLPMIARECLSEHPRGRGNVTSSSRSSRRPLLHPSPNIVAIPLSEEP